MVLWAFWTENICHMVATSAHFIQTKHEHLGIIIMFHDIQWHHSIIYNFMPQMWSLNSSFAHPRLFNSLILQVCNSEYAFSLNCNFMKCSSGSQVRHYYDNEFGWFLCYNSFHLMCFFYFVLWISITFCITNQAILTKVLSLNPSNKARLCMWWLLVYFVTRKKELWM